MLHKRKWFILLAVALIAGAFSLHTALAAPGNVGALDPTFGGSGRTGVVAGGFSSIADIMLQPDGDVVVAGNIQPTNTQNSDSLLVRYTPAGAFDTSFGNGGQVTTHYSGGNSGIAAVALQADGKIVAVGGANDDSQPSIAVTRYHTDGSLDLTFGNGGVVTTTVPGQLAVSGAVAIQSDQKIVIAGAISSTFAVLRYNSDGTLDSTFDGDGIAVTPIGDAPQSSYIGAVMIQADGKIVVAGGANVNACEPGQHGALARYNSDGSLDSSFGAGGKVLFAHSGFIPNIALQADQKILAVSSTDECVTPSEFKATVARFNTDGTPDSSFSGGYRDFRADFNALFGQDIGVATDGTVWVVGYAAETPVLASLNADGTMNNRFGTNGTEVTSIGFTYASELVVQPDGKVIIGGTTIARLARWILVARYLTTSSCSFADVCVDDFFYPAITYLAQHNVVSGYGDGAFQPYANTTRGQMAKIVVLAENIAISTPATGHTFADVPRNDTFFQFIETAAHSNIVSGYSCGQGCLNYRPYNEITRGQLSKIVAVAAGWQLQNPAQPRFSDVPASNPFYRYIETAAARGVVSGYADGTFGWGANATRGQIAKVVYLSVTEAEATATATTTSTPTATTTPAVKGKK